MSTRSRSITRAHLLVATALLVAGCRPRGPNPGAATVSAACAASGGVGRLTLMLATQPVTPETSEALVRLESETERSTVRVNAALGTTFELRPGRYRLSITLAGYSSAERQFSIECGAAQTLTVPLSKRR